MENLREVKASKSGSIFTIVVIVTALLLLCVITLKTIGINDEPKVIKDPLVMLETMRSTYDKSVSLYEETGNVDAKNNANQAAMMYSQIIKDYSLTLETMDLPDDFVWYLETIK